MDPELARALEGAIREEPALFWRRLFEFAAYAAACACVFRAIRVGWRSGPAEALAQVLAFASFVGGFWLLESWASQRGGTLVYAASFADGVASIPFEGAAGAGVASECAHLAVAMERAGPARALPLGVVLLAASLTASATWTARLLGARPVIQAFFAALVMSTVRLLLDPVLATVHDCATGGPLATNGFGLGLWRWTVDPSSAGTAQWFGIPVFHYLTWFLGPLLLVSLVNLLGSFRAGWLPPRRRGGAAAGTAPGRERLALLGIAFAAAGALSLAPDTLGRAGQWTLLAALLAIAVGLVRGRQGLRPSGHPFDASLGLPVFAALLVPGVAFVAEGFFVEQPMLVPVGVLACGAGLFLVLLPHRHAARAVCRLLMDVDRLLRLHYFSFTTLLVLLGAATVRPDPDAGLIGGLLLVAVCFHIHGYVLNDVVDLELDREHPLRRRDPLVRGAVSKETALALALVQIPAAALVTFHLDAGPAAWLALGTAFALSVVYDRWSKACPVPPVTDLVHALAWGFLAVFAMLVAKPDVGLLEVRERVVPLLALCVGFILLINGIHGGLRDLWNDVTHGRRTTALFLGARPAWEGSGGTAESSRGVIVFAFAVHVGMFLPSFEFLLRGAHHYDAGWYEAAWAGLGALFVASSWILWRVVRPLEAERGWWVSTHIFVLLLAPLVLYLPSNVPGPVFATLVLLCFFLPLTLQVGALERVARFFERGEDAVPEAAHSLRSPRAASRRVSGPRPSGPPPAP